MDPEAETFLRERGFQWEPKQENLGESGARGKGCPTLAAGEKRDLLLSEITLNAKRKVEKYTGFSFPSFHQFLTLVNLPGN